MRTSTRTAIILLAALAASAASASLPPAVPDCQNSLPQSLDVGLPYREGLEAAQVELLVREVFQEQYRNLALCPNRPLQVNVAVGSDYQILDWLTRGTVDVAVVSALTRHILLREGVDLREIESLPALAWLAPAIAELHSYDIDGDRRRERPDPAGDLERYRTVLLERASSPHPPPADSAMRLVFASHLATIGFLDPVAATQHWLEDRLPRSATDERERQAVRERFWNALFEDACFRLGVDSDRASAPCAPTAAGGAGIEIETLGTPVAGGRSVGPLQTRYASGQILQDDLVIRGEAADAMFRPQAFDSSALKNFPLESELEPLFGSRTRAAAGREISAFDSHLRPEPYFGTRTFAFTIDETLRLLALDQKTSGRPQLALVLPGGGVKAAYQSRLIDDLYGKGRLRNRLVEAPRRGHRDGLDVDEVVGTSGGALLGFFVARLGAHGPWKLSEILWQHGAGANALRVTASDIFPSTDLPRYVSLVAILTILGIGLAWASLGREFWLAPPARETFDDGVTGRAAPGNRRVLMSALAALLFGTPLAVRWASGDSLLEHIPEFEGLLFTVLIVGVMFVDQCLVCGARRERAERRRSRSAEVALVAGLTAISLSTLAAARWREALQQPVGAGIAYAALLLLAAAVAFVAVRRRTERPASSREAALWVLALVGGPIAAYLALRLAGERVLSWTDGLPVLVLAMLVTLCAVLAARFLERRSGFRAFLETQKERLARSRPLRSGAVVLVSFFACLTLLDFTRPRAALFVATPLARMPAVPSKLGAPIGGFAISLGALLTLAGLTLTLVASHERLRLEGTRKFVNAVLVLVVAQALAVYLLLIVLAVLRPSAMTLFELTPEFWLGIGSVAVLTTIALLLWGRRGRAGRGLARQVYEALRYLTSRHPDGHWVSRRFVRLGLVAGGGLLWWNMLVAPALYGNRKAYDYLLRADARFDQQYAATNGTPEGSSYRLTTQLLAPANALHTDGTRFVLAVPGSAPCPAIRQPPGSGATWYPFHALAPSDVHSQEPAGALCEDLHLANPDELQTLRGFIFASGSPFPIFPAHRVQRNPRSNLEALVDGGYSNNTPVEAASTLGAEQVLIVNSSRTLPCAPERWSWLYDLPGPLVANALRLPAFLFERAQQLDRRGRAGLFVVSLSPTCQPGWPILSDFRATTVERMQRAAEADLGRRIGMVESWGPPRFQVSVRIGNWGGLETSSGTRSAKRD